MLFAINLMNFFDRQILGAVGEQIRREWGLGDTALGALGTAFTLLYAFVGVPVRTPCGSRAAASYILAGGVFVWSLLTAASGLARNFWQLFVIRLGVGVGEASCAPAAISLIGDLYRTQHRARATSVFMLGLPHRARAEHSRRRHGRATVGLADGACSSPRRRDCCARSPRSSSANRRAGWSRPTRSAIASRPGSPYKVLLSIPTLWWIIASGALHNFNMYALGSFLGSFLDSLPRRELSEAGFVADVGLRLVGHLRPDRGRHRRRRVLQQAARTAACLIATVARS